MEPSQSWKMGLRNKTTPCLCLDISLLTILFWHVKLYGFISNFICKFFFTWTFSLKYTGGNINWGREKHSFNRSSLPSTAWNSNLKFLRRCPHCKRCLQIRIFMILSFAAPLTIFVSSRGAFAPWKVANDNIIRHMLCYLMHGTLSFVSQLCSKKHGKNISDLTQGW